MCFPSLSRARTTFSGELAISVERAREQAQLLGHTLEKEIRILMLHGVLHLLGMDHEKDRGRMARAETRLEEETRLAGWLDRAGARMTPILTILTILFAVLLAGVTFVQVLYLESLRLRSRDLPALEFFKETLKDRIGLKAERGALAFSLLKHTADRTHRRGSCLRSPAAGRRFLADRA